MRKEPIKFEDFISSIEREGGFDWDRLRKDYMVKRIEFPSFKHYFKEYLKREHRLSEYMVHRVVKHYFKY